MELKYCERCGCMLGYVRATKKYCSECEKQVRRERDRQRKERKKMQARICLMCKKPMFNAQKGQKYHPECKPPPTEDRKRRKAYALRTEERKKPTYSVWQVQMMADRLGIHYGQASMGLANGTLTMDEDIASGSIKRKPNN